MCSSYDAGRASYLIVFKKLDAFLVHVSVLVIKQCAVYVK